MEGPADAFFSSVTFCAAFIRAADRHAPGRLPSVFSGRPRRQRYLHVSSHVGACVSCSAAVKSLKTANEYCAKQSRVVVVRNTNGAVNPFGYDNGNQLVFSCVLPNDPEYARPELRKDNGVTTIQNR